MLSVNSAFGELVGLLEPERDKPGMVLAGGYVRDSALGLPVKDADFFVQRAYLSQTERKELGEKGWRQVEGSAYAHMEMITAVYNNKERYSMPVDLVLVRVPPVQFIEEYFDWGLCKCYNTYNDTTVFTPHFERDYEQRKHTVYYSSDKHNAFTVLEHGKRLQAKYPWPMEVKL